MIKLEEQPIVTPENYLFNTWIKGTEIVKTEKGDITVLEILTDFRKHLLQNLEHNKEAYHQKQCAIHCVNHSRMVGKTNAMIIGIKATLEQGKEAGVAGCKDPQHIIKRLKDMGMNALSKPMVATQPMRAKYTTDGMEEFISGFDGGEKTQVGFIFYCG